MFSASFWKYLKKHKELAIDFLVILVVVVFSLLLVTSKIEDKILGNFVGYEYIPYFLAGIFSTNFITAFPAYTFLAKVVTPSNFWLVASMGAIGSVVGDTLIFSFIKFRLIESMIKSFKHNKFVISILKTKNHILKYLLIMVGCLIIMSPLPDEFGVLLI